MFCDLHTHSIFSDGTYTPEELIDAAINIGLSAIALTDHNTVDGLPNFISASVGKNIDIVLGTEFSVDYDGKELHMLALFIKPQYFSQITELMNAVIIRKEQSYIDLIDALSSVGINLDYNEIKSLTPSGKINRAHIASAMMQKGYVSSIIEAFQTYLSKTGGYYKEAERINVWEMLNFINSIGAVSVLAHPFLNLREDELISFLTKAKEFRLAGMECYYPLYDDLTTEKSLKIADRFNILPSGGSDFHGLRKPDINLGVGKGNLKIPYEWFLALKEKSN